MGALGLSAVDRRDRPTVDSMTTTIERPTTRGQSTGAKTARRQNAERGFTASKQLTDSLQKVLVDLVELGLQGKQAHWDVVGTNFRDLHLQLDQIVEESREFADVIAERMRGLHAVPDGRTDTIAATTTLPEFPMGEVDTAQTVDLVVKRLDGVVATIREVHDGVDEEDPSTSDLLHQMIVRLEQFSWMVGAENRTAGKR